MKKLLAVLVVLGLCGLYWYGCQKKGAPAPADTGAAVTQPAPEAATPPPPPPPPPPPAEEEAEGEQTE